MKRREKILKFLEFTECYDFSFRNFVVLLIMGFTFGAIMVFVFKEPFNPWTATIAGFLGGILIPPIFRRRKNADKQQKKD